MVRLLPSSHTGVVFLCILGSLVTACEPQEYAYDFDPAAQASDTGCAESRNLLLSTDAVAQASTVPGQPAGVHPGSSSVNQTLSTQGQPGVSGPALPQACDFRVITHFNNDRILSLRANTEIADNGELNANIFVPDDFVVENVEVRVRGLYHEYASDLRIRLMHSVDTVGVPGPPPNESVRTAFPNETASLEVPHVGFATLVDRRGGAMDYGAPRPHVSHVDFRLSCCHISTVETCP